MGRKRTLADDLAELASTAPTKELDLDKDELGQEAALVESDEEPEVAPAKKRSRKAPEKGFRLRGAIDLGDAAYAGRRISREAAFADAAAAEEDSDGDLLAEKSSDDEQPDREEVEDEAASDEDAPPEDRPPNRAGSAPGPVEHAYAEMQASDAATLQQMRARMAKEQAKGEAARHQQAIWDRLLEVRILLQKGLAASHQLPRPHAMLGVRSAVPELADGLDKVRQASSATVAALLDLHNALLVNNPAIAAERPAQLQPLADRSIRAGDAAEAWQALERASAEIAPFRDASLDRWHRKTLLSSGGAALKGQLRLLNQSLSSQVANMMRNPERLMQRTQLPAATAPRPLCSLPEDNPQDASGELGPSETDPETYDDSEFYQQLLREFLEASHAAGSLGTKSSTRGKKSKAMVDRRASKGRRLRYDVQEKLVNFMAPRAYEEPAMASRLFRNLFGQRTS